MKIKFVALDRQHEDLKEKLLAVTNDVLSSGRFVNGEYTARFEEWLAQTNNSAHALTCNNGTQALEIIAKYWHMLLLETDRAPTIDIPTLTFPSTANAFINAGWRVNLVDCEGDGLVRCESHRPSILVGLHGQPVIPSIPPAVDSEDGDLDLTMGPQNVWSKNTWERTYCAANIIFEDGAQHWLSANCRRIGLATAISFDPTKNLPSTGCGGAIVTNNDHFNTWARSYKQHGLNCDSNYTMHGSNCRMSELECAHLLVRSGWLDEWQRKRRRIVKLYNEAFKSTDAYCMIRDRDIETHACQKYTLLTMSRNKLLQNLQNAGIECKIHYRYPLHELQLFERNGNLDMLSNASALSRQIISLPLYPELDDNEINYIIEQVIKYI